MARHHFPDVYESLEDGRYFVKANVAGISLRQDAAATCYQGQALDLVRDTHNQHDQNAIAVFAGTDRIGYVPRDMNSGFAEYLDSGRDLDAEVHAVVGGTPDKPILGVVMAIYLPNDVQIEFEEL